MLFLFSSRLLIPVDIHYTPQPEANYLHAAITTVFQIQLIICPIYANLPSEMQAKIFAGANAFRYLK